MHSDRHAETSSRTHTHTMGYTTSLATYSTAALAASFAAYLVFTGSGTQFNPGAFIEQTSPYAWALAGIGLNIGLSVAGAGWSVSPRGPRAFTATRPRLTSARTQGHLDHRREHPRRERAHPAHPHKEPHLVRRSRLASSASYATLTRRIPCSRSIIFCEVCTGYCACRDKLLTSRCPIPHRSSVSSSSPSSLSLSLTRG